MTPCIRAARLALIVAACLTHATAARAQTGANVLVVVNSASPASETIGRQYATRRGVPSENICSLQLPVTESISRDVYDVLIEQPVWKCIASTQAHDRILYIVLTKDVPLRISGTNGRNGTNASVDSELTLLYRRRTDVLVPAVGFVSNPYFADPASLFEPFSHRRHDIYLVTRLDGYTVKDALDLIERGSAGAADGLFVLAQRTSSADSIPNRWVGAAGERLTAKGLSDRVVVDATFTKAGAGSRVLGYYSWGSNDEARRARAYDFTFAPGALAGWFVSTDARTFNEPPAHWRPGADFEFGGTNESLIGDLIRAGITGVSGNVNEPYFDAAIRPDILFPAYVSGRNLAEAFYAAMPYLSWQTIIVGDPLCAPFPRASVALAEVDPPLDASTELPSYFAKRQLATMYPELPRPAAAAFIRFQSHSLRNDSAGARQALEAAIAAEPQFIPARVELAVMDQRAGDWDTAIAQYRAILQYSPNDPLTLNNLAYALAIHQQRFEEALSFAKRALTAARTDPTLLGDSSILNYYTLGSHRRQPMIPCASTPSPGCSICWGATWTPRARSRRCDLPAGCRRPTSCGTRR
jgi:uncharacterized protein (TIGR03790 family)